MLSFKQTTKARSHDTLERKPNSSMFGDNQALMKRNYDEFSGDYGSPLNAQPHIDTLVAQEINQLSTREREKMLYDVHAIVDIPDENALMVDSQLAELEVEIQKIPFKPAYLQALSISEKYVKDKGFRLKFLRADSFNAANAARRLVSFFEQKLRIFGAGKLVKEITLADLSTDDLAVLENGHMMFLQRDMSGRLVFCNIRSRECFARIQNLVSFVADTTCTLCDSR